MGPLPPIKFSIMIFIGKTKNPIMRKMNNIVEYNLSNHSPAPNHSISAFPAQKALLSASKIAHKAPTLIRKSLIKFRKKLLLFPLPFRVLVLRTR